MFAWAVGSTGNRRIGSNLTDPLEVSVGEVETMQILEPKRDIYQLLKPVTPVSENTDMITHKLDSVHIFPVLDKTVDVPIIHPF